MRSAVLPLLLLAACNRGGASTGGQAQGPAVLPQVEGTYDYIGSPGFFLRGTVTFEQEGETVRVTDTTYANALDRALVGEGTLAGDRLDIVLVPENGDTDFRADVTFVFREEGRRFEVGFSDTNGDAGPIGSYLGVRRP